MTELKIYHLFALLLIRSQRRKRKKRKKEEEGASGCDLYLLVEHLAVLIKV